VLRMWRVVLSLVQFCVLSFQNRLILMSLLRLHLMAPTLLGWTFMEVCILLLEDLIELFVIFLALRIVILLMLMFYAETTRIITHCSFLFLIRLGFSSHLLFGFWRCGCLIWIFVPSSIALKMLLLMVILCWFCKGNCNILKFFFERVK